MHTACPNMCEMHASQQSRPTPTGFTVKSYTGARGVQCRDIHNKPVGHIQQCDGCKVLAEERMRESMSEMTHSIMAQQAGTP
jgi:hypothetical protein